MLANTRRFISSTPYKDIEVIDSDMENALTDMMESGLCFVAENGGFHFGGIGCFKVPLFLNSKIKLASECFFWVAPEYRKSGIGAELFDTIKEAAKAAGCTNLVMFSLTDIYVDKLYESKGMSKTDHTWMIPL